MAELLSVVTSAQAGPLDYVPDSHAQRPREKEDFAVSDTTTIARISTSSSGGSDGKMHTFGSADAPADNTVEGAWAASLIDVNTTAIPVAGGAGKHAPSEDAKFYIAMGVIGGFTCLSVFFGLYYMCRRSRSFSKTLYLVQELDAEAPINCLVSRRKLSNPAEVTRGRLQTVA